MLALLAPMTDHDVIGLVIVCFVMALLMWISPSCGHAACLEQHRIQSVKERTANIERNHAAFHSAQNPSPACGLCRKP